MDQQNSLAGLIGTWAQEAVAIWGDDWGCISRHIQSRFAGLDGETRALLEREAALTLSGADVLSDASTH